MVLESFTSPIKAENKPWKMFFIGFTYATVATFLSLWIFKSYASLVMVFLTVVATIPLMYSTLKYEEKKDTEISKESNLLRQHEKAIKFLVFMFLGFMVAYSVWFVALPAELVQSLFSSQLQTISSINSQITGAVTSSSIFTQIFFNNIKVLMFCIFFAFFYGAGAIFILTWNATVIAAAIGTLIKNRLAEIMATLGHLTAFNYFHIYSIGLLRYSIHGIPEITAYFVGGLAGGIISIAMINHDLETNKFRNIIMDALDLTMVAIFILFVAALIEVFVTPVFF